MRKTALILAASASTVMSTGAAANSAEICVKGADSRRIEVLTPGEVGRACDLRVVRDNGAYVSTPFHADNSAGYCATRAKDLVAGLVAEGFSCTFALLPEKGSAEAKVEPSVIAPSAPVDVAVQDAAPQHTVEAGPSVAGAPAEAAADAIQSLIMKTETETAEADAPVAPPSGIASQSVESVPAAASPDATQPAQETPATEVANGGPVALAPTKAAALTGVRAPRSAAGRLVGAAHDAKPLDIAKGDAEERLEPTPVSASPVAPLPQTFAQAAPKTAKPAARAAPAPAIAPVADGAKPVKAEAPKPRAAQDIIKGVLAAQAAAWNEGDLEGFMGVYWKDSDLRFVSGSTVSKGWRETMNRYRERYGEGAAIGRLSYDKLDVNLVSDDVATVTGRYLVERAAGSESASFTRVMKRFDGLWRIVHDHNVIEPAPATN
jgi:uncharacterized protein (TIGR02246 family)